MMLAKALASASASAPKVYVEDVFSTWLYTGNGSTQTITNGIDLSGKGGLVWLKRRNDISEHGLYDTARGAAKLLQSQSTAAQISSYSGVSAFAATGFDLGTELNASGGTYASWTFRKAAKFFDVVTYTGNGSNRTIAHNLGSVPGCIIVKCTSGGGLNWQVYHRSLGGTKYLSLNTTDSETTSSTRWNNTDPTSTVFSIGTDNPVNLNGETYVAYLFAHDAGGFGDSGNDSVVKCGTFTGTTTIDLGWEPQWLLIKRTDSTGSWWIVDTMRGLNVSTDPQALFANLSNAETATFPNWPPNATGFSSAATGTYIYIAIRRGPMKTPTDATTVFHAKVARDASSTSVPSYSAPFPVDLAFSRFRIDGENNQVGSRLQGLRRMYTNTTSAETTSTDFAFDYQAGWGNIGGASSNFISWMFRRAPGFFDVVAYTGTGANRTVNHNLGVVPELMIVKRRNIAQNWAIYCAALSTPTTSFLRFTNGAVNTGIPEYWNSTAPTSTVFSLGTDNDVNASTGTFIAYLFATCPGVSKCFNYTGTGTTLQINCGFTNGARFVMIKRTDSTGDWYVWDSARGIISGNDPYLLLNSTAAEVTNTDYIDPYSAGFEISSTAPAAINANGGSYIGLAIA